MEPIITLNHVCKTFTTADGEVTAVNDLNFTINRGDIFGIIGLSGAGKSTLVRCLNLLERPTQGQVLVDGKDLTTLNGRELRESRRNIGMIFQHFNLLMQRTVLDNVCFPMELAGVKKKEARKKALELLDTVDLADKAKAYPAQLSGGQKQRVAIARVLAADPEILLCDEATSALDPQTTKAILSLLKEINEKLGITIVVITHEMAVVQAICNRVGVLENGVLVEQGDVEQLFRNPQTSAARNLIYNGTAYKESITAGRKVRITFEGNSSFEPILGNIILECKTPVNILYANTQNVHGKAVGQMILQLPEEKELADRFVEYFHQKNLGVEEVEEDA